MSLMTEVFDVWAAERMQKQPLQAPYAPPFVRPNPYAQRYPYAHPPQVPQGQPWPQTPQQAYPPTQAPYNYGSAAQMPVQPAGHRSVMQSPAPSYTSPVPHNAMPNSQYGYAIPPQHGAVEMPAELPGETLIAAAAPVPTRSISTDVSFLSAVRLARDLWGADSNVEEEEVAV